MIKSIKDSSILNYIIVLYAFFIPLSLDLIRILAPLIIILWFVQGGVKSKIALIKKEPFFLSIGVLLLILLISLLWTDIDNIKFGIKYIKRYWYILPMFVIYTSIDKKFIPITLSAFLAGMFISELVSYGIFFEFIHIEGVPHWDPSPFMQHTLYSIFLVITAGILLNRILLSKPLLLKTIYILFFLTVTANLFINSGRTGQFLFLLVLFIVIINRYKITLKSIALITVLSLAIPYLAFTFSPNFHQRILLTYSSLSHFSYTTNIGVRIGLNIVAKDIFLADPVLGVGAGDYLSEKSKVVEEKYPDWARIKEIEHYHNQYAEFLVMAGIFGLLAYLMILITLAPDVTYTNEMKTIKMIFILSFAIASLSDAMFHLNRPLSLFALFAGLILAHYRYEQSEIKGTSNLKNHISHK